MKVLVTGGTGMLGRSLLDVLRVRRPDLEILAPSRRDLPLLEPVAVAGYLANNPVDTIVHCAAKVGGIQANINDPAGFLYENALISLNVIKAAVKSGVPELLFMGSSCIYPRGRSTPLTENDILAAPFEPTNEGYALAKVMGARFCEYCNRQFHTAYKTVIPPNLYGKYDHFDPVSSHLIAAILLKLHRAKVEGQPVVEIWGDGTARREFLYCEDLAGYLADMIGHLHTFPDCLNVGYGTDFSVLEYYEIGREIVGYEGSFRFDVSRPTGMQRKFLDSSLAYRLGWKPKTPPREGMREVYKFILDARKEFAAQ